jgi:hypothetical protein
LYGYNMFWSPGKKRVFSHTLLPAKLLIPMHVKHTTPTCIYTCHPEDEPSGSEHYKTSKIKN